MVDALDLHMAEIKRLHPIKWDIYLSLIGADAWRMYRQDNLPVTLVLDMFATQNQYDAFTQNLYTTVQLYTRTAHYREQGDALVAAYEQLKTRFDSTMYKMEDYAASHFLNTYTLLAEYGVNPIDPRVEVVNRLATSMINIMYRSYQGLDFVIAMADLWFTICDATLTAPAA